MARSSSKYSHSVLVARIMRSIAIILNGDPTLWERVGLLHDIDYDLVAADMSKHGVLGASMLEGKLPEVGLRAIRSHNQRSFIRSHTLLDRALVFSDCLAALIVDRRLSLPCDIAELLEALRVECIEKPWIGDKIIKFSEREGISLPEVLMRIVNVDICSL